MLSYRAQAYTYLQVDGTVCSMACGIGWLVQLIDSNLTHITPARQSCSSSSAAGNFGALKRFNKQLVPAGVAIYIRLQVGPHNLEFRRNSAISDGSVLCLYLFLIQLQRMAILHILFTYGPINLWRVSVL